MFPVMPAAEVMQDTHPVTRSDLVRDLRGLGVQPVGLDENICGGNQTTTEEEPGGKLFVSIMNAGPGRKNAG